MKTIFSYLSKCLLVYTISFALLQVQVLLPIQNLKYSAGYVQAEDNAANENIGTDDDGVRFQKGAIKLDEEEEGVLDVSMDIISSFLMGWFTSRAVMICKPVPTDVWIATAGAAIYIGGEIYAFNAFKDIRDEKILDIKMREDGNNTEQVEYLTDQKKTYDDIAETAKMKYNLQMAATAAYGIAAIWALAVKLKWHFSDALCSACATTLAPVTAETATKEIPGTPSKIKTAQLYAQCAAIKVAIVAGNTNVATASTCAPAAAGCASTILHCTKDAAICLPSAASVARDNSEPNLYQKFAQENLKLPSYEELFTEKDMMESLEEVQVESITSKYDVTRFIDNSSPFYDLGKSLEIDHENFETQINSYAENRDRMRFFKGELSSSSYEQYESFREGMIDQGLNSSSGSIGDALQLALNNGVDFFIPRANANSVITMLGSIVGIVLALFATTSQFLDTFMSTPGYRSIAWTTGTVLAGYAASKTKEVQETAEANSTKIQKIIDRLNEIGKLNTETISGVNSSIPSRIPYPITGNDAITLGPEKTPCPEKNGSENCSSLVTGSEESKTFEMGGGVSQMALNALEAGDGFTGEKVVKGPIVDKTLNLARENEAVQKKLRKMQRKINDQLKKDGKPGINFDKLTKNMIAKLRKKTQDQLKKSGTSADKILASLGTGSKSEEKESTDPVIKGPSKATAATGGKVKAKKAPAFSLDLDDDAEDSGVSADDVAANQAAANALNEESADDIVTNKGVSIFKVISVRYLKSGFSRLLEEEKKASK
jgi:hypothetical protein